MKTFLVTQREVWTVTHEIEAEDEQAAKDLISNEYGKIVNQEFYSDVTDNDELRAQTVEQK